MATGITILAASAVPLIGLLAAFRNRMQGTPANGEADPRLSKVAARAERGAAQLRVVDATGFQTVPLLPAAAARFLPLIETVLFEDHPDLRVMAQANLGELICPIGGTDAEAAYTAICTKQLQFAIVNLDGILVCALDCPTAEPYRSTSPHRDTIKRRALEKAGVPHIELPADGDLALVRNGIHAALGTPAMIRQAAE